MDHGLPCLFPPEDLKDHVSHFWVSRSAVPTEPSVYYATANTHTELAFAFRTTEEGRTTPLFSTVLGHTAAPGQYALGSCTELFGASVYAHAVPDLFDVSPADLDGRMTEIDHLAGPEGSLLTWQLTQAQGTWERIAVLSGYFRSRLHVHRSDRLILHAVREIRKREGILPMRELAASLCLSEKQFERRFRDHSGFTPKVYSRIIRFESALWNSGRYRTLSELAHAYGYYDQAHFIRDFRQFSGFSPGRYLSLAHGNDRPLEDVDFIQL